MRYSRLAAFGTLAACLDVSRVPTDPGTSFIWPQLRSVDSFENEDRAPDWSLLLPAVCLHWPDGDLPECGRVQPGADGNGHSQYLDFDVTASAPDDYQNLALQFERSGPLLDLGSYDRIVFRTRFTAKQSGSLPSDLELRVAFTCPSVNPAIRDGVSVQSAVYPMVDGSWQTFALDLRDFGQPFWQEGDDIDRSQCLANVETFEFVLASNSIQTTSNHRMAGRFELDDVVLQTLEQHQSPRPEPEQLLNWNCVLLPSGAPAAESADAVSCDGTPSQQSLSFTLDARREEQTVLLRSWLYEVDSSSHAQRIAVRDWSTFRVLAFEAQFVPAEDGARQVQSFDLSVGCDNLIPGSRLTVDTSFEASPEWSSYLLPLNSFDAPEYPIGFSDVPNCIAHAQGLVLSPRVALGEVGAGTLHIRNLALR